MFKRLETAWNSRTPEYLHNGTKANLIWQLKMTGLLFVVLYGWDKYKEYRDDKKERAELRLVK